VCETDECKDDLRKLLGQEAQEQRRTLDGASGSRYVQKEHDRTARAVGVGKVLSDLQLRLEVRVPDHGVPLRDREAGSSQPHRVLLSVTSPSITTPDGPVFKQTFSHPPGNNQHFPDQSCIFSIDTAHEGRLTALGSYYPMIMRIVRVVRDPLGLHRAS
jgi:hypothetical protein